MQPPDITRVFKGPQNEFEVEIVFARELGIDYNPLQRKIRRFKIKPVFNYLIKRINPFSCIKSKPLFRKKFQASVYNSSVIKSSFILSNSF